ncbi:MAG: ribbon-helix-helix protein, CopG family [Janthinobacterium lividum]
MKTASLSFRVADDVKAGLELAAAADGRSVSSFVERILRAWLDQHSQNGQKPEPSSTVGSSS